MCIMDDSKKRDLKCKLKHISWACNSSSTVEEAAVKLALHGLSIEEAEQLVSREVFKDKAARAAVPSSLFWEDGKTLCFWEVLHTSPAMRIAVPWKIERKAGVEKTKLGSQDVDVVQIEACAADCSHADIC